MIFRFFHYIWLVDSEHLFYSNFERKNYKTLTLDIAHFANFEINTLTVSKFNKRWERLLEEIRYSDIQFLNSCDTLNPWEHMSLNIKT